MLYKHVYLYLECLQSDRNTIKKTQQENIFFLFMV